ncbi:MAG: tRNA pseudouridine(38-40) synthase TruA [Vampirovibrionia bacterium]
MTLKPETDSNKQSSKFKYAMLFEYDGRGFYGSQIQPGLRTVQDELEKALLTALRKQIRVVPSGRTDTGVSALGQVAHFVTDEILDTTKAIHSLNGLLPGDIAVRAIEQVDDNFEARKLATKRWYRFTIYNHPQRSALNPRALHVKYPLDENLMHKALEYINGTHEFDSFKSANSNNPASKCTIYKTQCFREGNHIYIDIVANRFLYNMIRIIVGTLLKIGQKQESVLYLDKILKAQDRTKAGKTVKPDGLTLMAVEYPEEYNLFDKDTNPKIRELMLINYMEAQNEDIFSKAS